MAANAVVNTALGFVLRCGECDFTAGTGETVEALTSLARPANVPLYHLGVTAGELVELGAAEKAAVDAYLLAEGNAECWGVCALARVYSNAAALPLPPPKSGLVVGLDDSGSGQPGLALSTATQWAVFQPAAMVGP